MILLCTTFKLLHCLVNHLVQYFLQNVIVKQFSRLSYVCYFMLQRTAELNGKLLDFFFECSLCVFLCLSDPLRQKKEKSQSKRGGVSVYKLTDPLNIS
jgi:hypothetical protein